MKIISKSNLEKYTRTVGTSNEVDEIMRLPLVIQRIFGQQVLDPNWTWKRDFPQQLVTVALTVYVILGTVEFLDYSKDIKIFAEASYTCVIITIFPIKYILFASNVGYFRKLYFEVKTNLYEAIKRDSLEKSRIILKRCQNIIYVLLSSVAFVVGIYFLTTIWFYIHGKRVTMSPTTSIIMPMKTPYHEVGTILHAIFMSQAGLTLILVDVWYVLLMFFFVSSCDSIVNILKVEQRGRREEKLEYANRLNISLRSFYKAHVQHVEFLKTINAMFKWLALIPLLNVAMCSCIIFLLMSKGVDWTFVPNILPCFGELFIYNWYGEQVKSKAEDINMALLDFDWINLQTKDKKSYKIIICYVKKDFGLRTGAGNELSLVTMTTVLKASYQAFTVLQTMDL